MMATDWRFRKPKRTGDADPTTNTSNKPQTEQHRWTAGTAMTTRVALWGLWAAVIAGPVALTLQLLPSEAPPIAPTSESAEPSGEVAAVGEFAQEAVVAWLETPADAASALTPYFGGLETIRPQHPWQADNTEVAEIAQDDSGLWSVLVGVDVTAAESDSTPTREPTPDDGEQTAQPRAERLYVRIPILYVQGAMVAQALPAVVSGPETTEQLDPAYETRLASSHPAYPRVHDFLQAILVTGNQAAIEAYSAPSSAFRPFDAGPFTEMEVRSLVAAGTATPSEEPADGERAEVQATVELSDENQQRIQSQYALVLVAREGRWEVAEMPGVPTLREPVPSPTPSATSPSGSDEVDRAPDEPAEDGTSNSDLPEDKPSEDGPSKPDAEETPDDQPNATGVPWDEDVIEPSADPTQTSGVERDSRSENETS